MRLYASDVGVCGTKACNVVYFFRHPASQHSVTFTESDNNRVLVNTNWYETCSADVSTWMSLMIIRAFSSINLLLTGANITASGNPVVLDWVRAARPILVVIQLADHPINAAEAAEAPFTALGSGGRDYPGTVTFTELTGRQDVGNIGSNGTYSANLWNLTNGSSGTSATGNASALPSLTVDATNPVHVTFTVSGLASDYSGTVTFTDASGKQDVVPVEFERGLCHQPV